MSYIQEEVDIDVIINKLINKHCKPTDILGQNKKI